MFIKYPYNFLGGGTDFFSTPFFFTTAPEFLKLIYFSIVFIFCSFEQRTVKGHPHVHLLDFVLQNSIAEQKHFQTDIWKVFYNL